MTIKALQYYIRRRHYCKELKNWFDNNSEYEYYLKHSHKHSYIKASFYQVSLYDKLDNDGLNKLIRRLYELNKCSFFCVHTNYLHSPAKKLDYINFNLHGTTIGSIADVKLLNNKWLKEINITFTYINSSEVIVEYTFIFSRIINTPMLVHNFITDNFWYLENCPAIKLSKNASIKGYGYSSISKYEKELLADILQSYICNLFYTKMGQNFGLPLYCGCKLDKHNSSVKKQLRNQFLCYCYEKENAYLLESLSRYNHVNITNFYKSKVYSDISFLSYFTEYSMEMYYKTFDTIEDLLLEHKMRQYLNSRRHFISSNDIKWLTNKLRYIIEQEDRICNRKNSYRHLNGWKKYFDGVLRNEDFINPPQHIEIYKKLYTNSLEYLKSISSVQNDTLILIITMATLILTGLSILVNIL